METLTVSLPDTSYPILVGADLLRTGTAPEPLVAAVSGCRCLLVSDDNVAPLYAAVVEGRLLSAGAAAVETEVISAGEASKTLATMGVLYERAVEARLDRGSIVVALGGGVVGDLAGFLAATYMRGIACVQVPTSLLAMVDSGVGGKTGVDLPWGKNLVGAFHQPRLVLADTTVLETLPRREFSAGLAEVVKYAFIMAPDFAATLERDAEAISAGAPAVLASTVRRCCELKAEIVADDEREAGRRAILNYGHTFGHALEVLGGYQRYRHGEGVSIGMGMAADCGVAIGLTPAGLVSRQDALLKAFGLPVCWDLPGVEAAAVMEAMYRDKKVQSDHLRLVLLENLGRAVVREQHDLAPVLNAIGGRREQS